VSSWSRFLRNQDNSVGVVTRLQPEQPWFNSLRTRDFSLFHRAHTGSGAQPAHCHCVPERRSPELKQQGREADTDLYLMLSSRKYKDNYLYPHNLRSFVSYAFGRAIAEVVSCWLSTAAAWVQSRVWSSGICGGQWRRGRFPPSTSVSPAIHSTKFSILSITQGRYNRPVNGRRAEWTQFGLHPALCKLKKKVLCFGG
jgi:hypothetical protein